MARGRRKPPPTAYERRNARAKAAGYKSYYDYRVHNHGKIPAGQPAPKGEARQRLRGHRSASDLEKMVGEGWLVTIGEHSERQPDGTFTWVDLNAVAPDGTSRTFRLRGKQLQGRNLRPLIEGMSSAGAILQVAGYPAFAPRGQVDVGQDDEGNPIMVDAGDVE